MMRNRVLYRKLWYIKRRQTGRLRALICLLAVFGIFIFVVSYSENKILPFLVEISEFNTKSEVNKIIYKVVEESIDSDISYNKLVNITKNYAGQITSIQVNAYEMNRLTSQIAGKLQNELDKMDESSISVPLGALTGKTVLSSFGPGLKIKTVPQGNAIVDFKSEFINVGGNQTLHRVFIEVKVKIAITIPMAGKIIEVATKIPLTETVFQLLAKEAVG